MWKKVLIGLTATVVLIVVVFVIAVAMQPSEFRVERTATMSAPPEKVFVQVNDFHNWEAWSPWAKLDPAAKNSFEGSSSGEGAIFRWSGNDEVGEGSMTLLKSRPNELVRIRLDFVKPMEDTATSEFTFKPEGDQTRVTWAMYGKNNFIGRALCMFMNMDEMIGSQFEQGLANMKSVVETDESDGESATSAESSDPSNPPASS